MSNISINEIPTLVGWFSDFEAIETDNTISAYVDEMKDCIVSLQFLVDDFRSDDEKREMLNHCSRLMASVLHDLKALRSDIRASIIISKAGLKPKKGGEA
jgi:hypothetical protein